MKTFWEPIFRAWLMALPYFIVGMGGLYMQVRRLRQHITRTVQQATDRQTAQLTQKTAPGSWTGPPPTGTAAS